MIHKTAHLTTGRTFHDVIDKHQQKLGVKVLDRLDGAIFETFPQRLDTAGSQHDANVHFIDIVQLLKRLMRSKFHQNVGCLFNPLFVSVTWRLLITQYRVSRDVWTFRPRRFISDVWRLLRWCWRSRSAGLLSGACRSWKKRIGFRFIAGDNWRAWTWCSCCTTSTSWLSAR